MNTEQVQETAQKGFEVLQDNVSQLVERAKPVAENVMDRSKQVYKNAVESLPENSEKYIGLAALGLVSAFVGYQLGKGKKPVKSTIEKVKDAAVETKKELASDYNEYFVPAFKFVKLWMFYRLSR